MIQSILSNLAIILMMHLVMSMLMSYKKQLSARFVYVATILLVSMSVISMFYLPIRFGGFLLDMRFIPLVFYGYFWGWKMALPPLLIAALWRFFMGGDGAIPGIIFGMVAPTLLALIFHHRSKIEGEYLHKILLILACWFICDFPIVFFIPGGVEIFQRIGLLRLTTFVGTSIIWYSFIMLERQRSSLNERLQKLAGEDPLTRLLNKRRFYEVAKEKIESDGSMGFIAMMDIDHFKNLNDTYGHVVGDDILIKVGRVLKESEIEDVLVGRYGGEEFIIYLGNSNFESAARTLDEIRTKIRNIRLILENGKTIGITVSAGLAEIEKDAHILSTVDHADKLLYLAKKNGRDRVLTYRDVSFLKTS